MATRTQKPNATPTQNTALLDWENSPHALGNEPVDCASCHRSSDGALTSEVAWLDNETGAYVNVSDKNEVCENCHTSYTHFENAHSSKECLDCHDPHNPTAQCKDCHNHVGDKTIIPVATPDDGHPNGVDSFCNGAACHASATQIAAMPDSGHPADHALLTCSACHDAGGLPIGPSEDGTWTTLASDDIGAPTAITSHDLQAEVDCQRCHFLDNPWGLSEQASDMKLAQ